MIQNAAPPRRGHLEVKELTIVTQKACRNIIALFLVLSLLWIGAVPLVHACTMQCCVQPDTQPQFHGRSEDRISGVNTCCCTGEEEACDLSTGVPREFRGLIGPASQRLDGHTLSFVAGATINFSTVLSPASRFYTRISAFRAAPPIPLYLLNRALLC
jgi:hypothetical protein